jgi:hypothetical protein
MSGPERARWRGDPTTLLVLVAVGLVLPRRR